MALDLLDELENSSVDWKAAIPELMQMSQLDLNWLYTKDYKAVTNIDELYALRDYLKDKPYISLDTETLDLLYTTKTVSVQLSAEPGVSYFVALRMDRCENVTPRQFCDVIGPILTNPELTLIFFNAKFDGLRLYNLIGLNKGINVFAENGPKIIDLRIIYKLKDPDQKMTLKILTEKKLKYKQLELQHLFKRTSSKKAAIKFQTLPLTYAIPYAGADSDCTLSIFMAEKDKILDALQNDQIVQLEHKVQKIIAKMEIRGCYINKHLLSRARKACVEEVERLDKLIKNEAGKDFQVNSIAQMQQYLYGTLGLQPLVFTDKGQPAVGKEALAPYKDSVPFVANVLKYKEASKLLTAFLDKIPDFCDAESVVHPNFNPLGAASGRFSCTDPNFQQLPKQKGSDLDFRQKIRGAIQPRPGYFIFDMDYSQIEYRTFASMCGDEDLKQAYREGKDFHQATAAMSFKVPYDQVTKLQRTKAKSINFGLLYGLSSFGLAQQIGCSEAEAKDLMEQYFEDKPRVREWQEEVHQKAIEKKYIRTFFGRIRFLRELYSKDRSTFNAGLRKSVNSTVQGTAADLLKIGFVRIDKCIRDNNYDVYMIATIHDEIVFEVAYNQPKPLPQVLKDLQEAMEVPMPEDWVPIVAEPEIGKDFGRLKEYTPDILDHMDQFDDDDYLSEEDEIKEPEPEVLKFVLPKTMAPIAFSRFKKALSENQGETEFELQVGDSEPKKAKSKVQLSKELVERLEDLGVVLKIPSALLMDIV